MSIENVVRRRAVLLEQLGKTGLNIKYPNEFELYVVALELVDEDFNTLKYFLFPVMPKSLEEDSQQLASIKKTIGGVHVLTTTHFIPTDISLSGTFGRRLRVLLNGTYTEFLTSFKTSTDDLTWKSLSKGAVEFFDENIKTGYGCTKILESLINDTNTISPNGGSRNLLFHNLALGNSYVVRPIGLKLSQNQESNMIWNYSLTLRSLAPLSAFYNSSELQKKRLDLGGTSLLQKNLDSSISSLTRFISRQDDRFVERVQRPKANKFKNFLNEQL